MQGKEEDKEREVHVSGKHGVVSVLRVSWQQQLCGVAVAQVSR